MVLLWMFGFGPPCIIEITTLGDRKARSRRPNWRWVNGRNLRSEDPFHPGISPRTSCLYLFYGIFKLTVYQQRKSPCSPMFSIFGKRKKATETQNCLSNLHGEGIKRSLWLNHLTSGFTPKQSTHGIILPSFTIQISQMYVKYTFTWMIP